MKILLTGYEAFLDFKINPTEEVVKALSGTIVADADIVGEVLTLNYADIGVQIRELITKHQPDAIVLMGQASRSTISIEKVAINFVNSNSAYNCGTIVKDTLIDPSGPTAYFSTLPVLSLVDELRDHGIPTTMSLSAGAYGCNQVFYEAMHYLTLQQLSIPAGFVHVPMLPEQSLNGKFPTMNYETIKYAIEIIITYIAKHLYS